MLSVTLSASYYSNCYTLCCLLNLFKLTQIYCCGNCGCFLIYIHFLLLIISSSLKQSGIHTGNPWPPYKERTPLHPCYKGLIKLLHCKTLHIVIFTLLYKVNLSKTIHMIMWSQFNALAKSEVPLFAFFQSAHK